MSTKKEKFPLSVTHPELAKEAVGWDPTTVTAGSNKKKYWRCTNGHEWEALVSNRSRGRGCKVCSNITNAENKLGKKVITRQLLSKTHPEISAEIVRVEKYALKKIKTNSARMFTWSCSLGHEYLNTPNNRSRGQACPYCSGRKVLIGFNDLATTHPLLAAQAYGWDPTTITYGTSKKLLWQCRIGHTWGAIVNLRSSQDTDCPICTGKIALAGFNDLATTHPDIASQANGWDPTQFTFGSSKKMAWKCSEGHRWSAVIQSRTPSFEWKPSRKLRPLTILATDDLITSSRIQDVISTIRKFSKISDLDFQGEVDTSPSPRDSLKSILTSRGRGCPTCAISGFDPNSTAWLYFLTHSDWQMFQIGITNDPDKRLGQHKKIGWEVLELRGPMEGHLTQQWETAILRMLKAKGADLSNSKIAGKFDGYSEAWSKSTFEIKSIKELMRLTQEFEGKNNGV